MNYTVENITHAQTNRFSKIVIDYLNKEECLVPFFNLYPTLENFEKAVSSNKIVNRTALVQAIKENYGDFVLSKEVQENLNSLLQEHTFTVCTAHQPLLFTGTLYFFYKILHAVKLSAYLKENFPSKNFVPIFYLGSEDADIDEVGTFNFRNTQYSWQNTEGGAVGRLGTQSLQNLVETITKQFNLASNSGVQLKELFQKAYLSNYTFAQATTFIVNELLGTYGVVIINPDHPLLKAQISTVLKEELFNKTSEPLVQKTSEALAEKYKVQAHSRSINLFYLKDNIRNRIEQIGTLWQVVDTELNFTKDELLEELANHPERFSPNVILRGVYQETILPNVAFIGGGGELAYWLQLQEVFKHHKVVFPILILRQSIQIFEQNTLQMAKDLNLDLPALFIEENLLHKQLLLKDAYASQLHNLETLHKKLFEEWEKIATAVNKPMVESTKAHFAKSIKTQTRLQTKLIANLKKKENVQTQKLHTLLLQCKLDSGLQERKDIFIDYFLNYGDAFFKAILNTTTPFGNQFALLKLL